MVRNKKRTPIISTKIAQSQKRFGDGMEISNPNSLMNIEGRKKVNKVHEG